MTILRKKKICIQCKQERFIFSHGRCEPCSKLVSKALKQGAKVEKQEGIPSLVTKLDTIFSWYIRLRNADKELMVICYTSGKRMHYKSAQCGHFISRRMYGTRWDEVNCQVQSVKENVFNQGNAPEFQRRLIADYGQQAVDLLFTQSKYPVKLDRMTLRYKIDHYTNMVAQLKKKLNIQE